MSNSYLDLIKLKINDYEFITGYGSSMGAFASIYFSKKLNFSKVIAISPQFSISVPWETRWSRYSALAQGQEINKNCINENCMFNLIFDSKNKDSKHIDLISKLVNPENINHIKLPRSGHPSSFYLSEIDQLKSTVLHLIENKDVSELQLSKKIKSSWIAMYEVSVALYLKGKYQKSLFFIDHSLRLSKEKNATLLYQKSMILIKLDLHNDAVEAAKLACHFRPSDENMKNHLKKLSADIK
jgi:tetratricopeptide (TPR) repeat protein